MTTSPSALTSPGAANSPTPEEVQNHIYAANDHTLRCTLLALHEILYQEGGPSCGMEFPLGTLFRLHDIMDAAGLSPTKIATSTKKDFRCVVSCTNLDGDPKLIPLVVRGLSSSTEKEVKKTAKARAEALGYTDVYQVFLSSETNSYLADSFFWGDAYMAYITKEEGK